MIVDNYGDRSNGRGRGEDRSTGKGFPQECRKRSIPVIFASDSFLEGDYIFGGRMKPHAIRGTEGARVLDDLEPEPSDTILPKRRFSAFFKTDLDQTCACGRWTRWPSAASRHIFASLRRPSTRSASNFRSIILEDLCAAYKRDIHEKTLDTYRNSPPLSHLRRDDLSRSSTSSPSLARYGLQVFPAI
jgi:hypothetical protein